MTILDVKMRFIGFIGTKKHKIARLQIKMRKKSFFCSSPALNPRIAFLWVRDLCD